MGFLSWLEDLAYSQWIVSGLTGWPIMLSMHAVGLAIIVGVSLALSLRLFGLFRPIPLTSLHGLMAIGWIGIALNVFSGVSLFVAEANQMVNSVPFRWKILFVILGIGILYHMQKILKRDAASWEAAGTVSQLGQGLAASSIACWTIAVVAGRLIAYL